MSTGRAMHEGFACSVRDAGPAQLKKLPELCVIRFAHPDQRQTGPRVMSVTPLCLPATTRATDFTGFIHGAYEQHPTSRQPHWDPGTVQIFGLRQYLKCNLICVRDATVDQMASHNLQLISVECNTVHQYQ